jgi:hypothetical protein
MGRRMRRPIHDRPARSLVEEPAVMSIFAVLHSSAPTSPLAALALAFPDRSISARPPFRIVLPGLDVTAVTPGRPNFLSESLGFEPSISMHFVLDKTALGVARSGLADATRSFLAGAAGSVVVLYGDVPVVARRPWGGWVRRGYEDLVEPEGWQVVEAVAIPRREHDDPPPNRESLPNLPAVTTITADVLGAWSRQLCGAVGGAVDIARSLGLSGELTERLGAWDLTPPVGGSKVRFVNAATATDRGVEEIAYVDVTLARPLPRSAFDTRFGSGRQLPRVHPGRPYKVAYHVTVAGAPNSCEVIAEFTDEPAAPETPAHGVTLRRDLIQH